MSDNLFHARHRAVIPKLFVNHVLRDVARTIIAILTIRSESQLRRPRDSESEQEEDLVVDRRSSSGLRISTRLAGLRLVRVPRTIFALMANGVRRSMPWSHRKRSNAYARTTTSADRQEEFTEGFHRTRRSRPQSRP
ncbi:hypothetical protein P5V15_000630 [Pogonomyrmex californicus]